jgi:hypothetical protein
LTRLVLEAIGLTREDVGLVYDVLRCPKHCDGNTDDAAAPAEATGGGEAGGQAVPKSALACFCPSDADAARVEQIRAVLGAIVRGRGRSRLRDAA